MQNGALNAAAPQKKPVERNRYPVFCLFAALDFLAALRRKRAIFAKEPYTVFAKLADREDPQ